MSWVYFGEPRERAKQKLNFKQLPMLEVNGSKFFTDDTCRAAEFAAFHHLDLSKELDPTLIKEFPRLETFISDVTELPEMTTYLKDRPKLISVSQKPQLVIDGLEHPTVVFRY